MLEQLALWSRYPVEPGPARSDHAPPVPEPTFTCGDCGRPISQEEFTDSLWGCCKECENDRLEDMWAG